MNYLCGLDFGTSNSVVAVLQNDIDKDKAYIQKRTAVIAQEPSVLFFPKQGICESIYFVGHEAIAAYLEHGMQGRFIQALKTLLSDVNFQGTIINKRPYTPADLVSFILGHFKKKAETVMIADLGGGTTDLTIMKLNPVLEADAALNTEVLVTEGVSVGGNNFDSDIMWHKLVDYFGLGISYESWGRMLEVPVHIFRILCKWEQIAFLKTNAYRSELKYYLSGSTNRPAIERLITLIDKNLGFSLFESIEKAKIDLSDWDAAIIDFQHADLAIHKRMTEPEFNHIIIPRLKRISNAVQRTLDKAGLEEHDISAVFLTGGSSLVRRVRKIFTDRFGGEKVKSGEGGCCMRKKQSWRMFLHFAY